MTDEQQKRFKEAKDKVSELFKNSGFKEMIIIFRTQQHDIGCYQAADETLKGGAYCGPTDSPYSVLFNFLMNKIESFFQTEYTTTNQKPESN